MPDVLTGRTLETSAAWPRATIHCPGAWRRRSSTAEPCLLWSIGPSVINILPLKTQVKHRVTTSPPLHYPLKFEITFCVRGVNTPPCGVPRFRSVLVPSSCTMGAFSHLSMYSSAHLCVTCFRTARNRSSWSMLSKEVTTHYPSSGPSRSSHCHPCSSSV